MNKKIVLLMSGGKDSTLLLFLAKYYLKYDVVALGFDYGQRHVAELGKAENICKKHKVEFFRIPCVSGIAKSKLTTSDEDQYEGVSEWYVPSRNLVFISTAACFAESNNINCIWFGANYTDRINLFPDCTQEWVKKCNELLSLNGSFPIEVEAPLLGMSKENIDRLWEVLQINEDVLSGYGE